MTSSSKDSLTPAVRFRVLRELAYRSLVPLVRIGNRIGRAVGSLTHLFQLKLEGVLRPHGEWYDHYVDANWQWGATGRSSFLERGVFNNLVMTPGASLLELCCGDGFFTRHFYAARASRVAAVDANPEALAHARRHNAAENISYESCDIRASLPDGPFDNVVWDSALHHFTKGETLEILALVKERLAPRGVLSGYTEVEDIPYAFRKVDFRGKADVAELLGQAFRHVMVIETPDPQRTNLYFFASDSKDSLPLDQHNPAVLVRSTSGHQEGRSHLGGSRQRSDISAG